MNARNRSRLLSTESDFVTISLCCCAWIFSMLFFSFFTCHRIICCARTLVVSLAACLTGKGHAISSNHALSSRKSINYLRLRWGETWSEPICICFTHFTKSHLIENYCHWHAIVKREEEGKKQSQTYRGRRTAIISIYLFQCLPLAKSIWFLLFLLCEYSFNQKMHRSR